jgi:hypothetical protein
MRSSFTRALLAATLVAGCSTRTTNLADSRVKTDDAGEPALDAGIPEAAVRDAAPVEGGGPVFRFDDAGVVLCGAHACACSDGLDNDGDNAFDGFDPECTGAFDDFEDSFATGRHGEEQIKQRQDCFYDTNSGGGDGCGRARCCSLLEPNTPGNSTCRDCAVDPRCTTVCGPLVPNGCDCFGCCGVWRDGVVTNILIGSASCTLSELGDPDKCTRCIPAPDCQNPCGACEQCPGRTVDDLSLACAGYTCEGGQTCKGSGDCGTLGYCQHGCCITSGI